MNVRPSSDYNNSVKFSGIPIAKSVNRVKNIETAIDLYQVTPRDKEFLHILDKKTNMKRLMPKSRITPLEFDIWHDMLHMAVEKAVRSGKKCVIAAVDKKPCGIMTYTPGHKAFELDYICTWPVETGKKVPLAGKTLFKHLFDSFLQTNASKINLTAMRNGPFNIVSKYSTLGFGQNGGENFFTSMSAYRHKIFNKMLELNDMISTTSIRNAEDVDLSKVLEV